MEINLEIDDLVRVVVANRTLRVSNLGAYLYATTPTPGAAAVLEVLRDGRINLILFLHVDDFRRWLRFTKRDDSTAYRVTRDGLESVDSENLSASGLCPTCNGTGKVPGRIPLSSVMPDELERIAFGAESLLVPCPDCTGRTKEPSE